jgi:hypothetical protein
MKTSGLIASIAWVVALVFPAAAQAPVAVVEDVTGSVAGVEFMDFVEAGKVIRLGPQGSIVLSYLKSCTRESIKGGTVTVGAERSDIKAGMVERTKEPCDTRKVTLSSQEANQAAGLVLRGQPPPDARDRHVRFDLPEPQLTLYGSSPIVELKGGGTFVIERLDKVGERHVETIAGKQEGDFFDFASVGKSLVAGGLYRASAGTRRLIFRIDHHAQAGRTPIIGRLLRLGRAG